MVTEDLGNLILSRFPTLSNTHIKNLNKDQWWLYHHFAVSADGQIPIINISIIYTLKGKKQHIGAKLISLFNIVT
jgi:hypothetical protein